MVEGCREGASRNLAGFNGTVNTSRLEPFRRRAKRSHSAPGKKGAYELKTGSVVRFSALRAGDCARAAGSQRDAAADADHPPCRLFNAAAQAAFDRGLLDYYAYNPEAANHEFYTAADLDPKMAMAWWGIALSNAPNLNVPPTDDRDESSPLRDRAGEGARSQRFGGRPPVYRRRRGAIQRQDEGHAGGVARQLSRCSCGASPKPTPTIPTLQRSTQKPRSIVAVGDLSENREGWTARNEQPYVKTVAALLPYFQSSLAKFPKHVGLLHFYIHAAQIANQSNAAVAAATQLAAFSFPPEDSHLTHMPGHTFFDVGMYQDALDVGQRSVAMDYAAIDCCHPGFYSAARYYHGHNVAFLLYAMIQTGHANDAVAVARRAAIPSLVARALVAAGEWPAVRRRSLRKERRSDNSVCASPGLCKTRRGLEGAIGAR